MFFLETEDGQKEHPSWPHYFFHSVSCTVLRDAFSFLTSKKKMTRALIWGVRAHGGYGAIIERKLYFYKVFPTTHKIGTPPLLRYLSICDDQT